MRGNHKNRAQIPKLNHPPFVSINILGGEEETKEGRQRDCCYRLALAKAEGLPLRN